MNDPIRKSITVPLSPAEAFALFTAQIDQWWPKGSHAITGPKAKLRFPSNKDGKITETGEDGEIVIWGEIIAYDPGKYLAFTWYPGQSKSDATVVTVSFSETAEGTLCKLVHGGFDILGETADAVSTSYLRGWDLVLGCYMKAAKKPVFA